MSETLIVSAPEIQRNLISADRADLPPTIRAIKSSALDADTLGLAASLLKSPVQTVQIEVANVPPELISLPHRLVTEHGLRRTRFESDIVNPQTTQPTPTWKIIDGVKGYFGEHALKLTDQPENNLLDEWKRLLVAMPQTARQVWSDALMGMWILNAGEIDQSSNASPSFHTHTGFRHRYITDGKEFPGVFLNFTPSGDGTVFKAKDGSYWYGKGGTYNLHVTEGHPDLTSPEHAAPDQFMSPIIGEKRATAVVQIYLPHFS